MFCTIKWTLSVLLLLYYWVNFVLSKLCRKHVEVLQVIKSFVEKVCFLALK